MNQPTVEDGGKAPTNEVAKTIKEAGKTSAEEAREDAAQDPPLQL